MPQPGRGQVEGRLIVGEGADYAGSSLDLPHDPLERMVGLLLDPVLVGEGVEAEGLLNVALDQPGRLSQHLLPKCAGIQ